MTEKKLTVGEVVKAIVFTVLAIIGFFVLWGMTFLLGLGLTCANFELSLLLSLLISAVTIVTLVTILTPRKRSRFVLSKRQKVGVYVVWGVIFIFSLPLIKINPLLFLTCLPALLIALFTLRNREKEIV